MKNIIIGTAGHIDHGKSALIKALTGTDTDRLQEEKLRGISIDLGFASLALSDELCLDIVDVPGHERFLKNMLAGAGGIDLAMLVIAADEGIMPQTKEHLAMLSCYGIKHGVVVINKIDKVDDEWLLLIQEEVEKLISETFLVAAPICLVSAITGEGLASLKENLLVVANQVTTRDSSAPFRMWIDRVFTVKGYGVVVTGSVLSGSAEVSDNLLLYPKNQELRIRGLECHGSKVTKIRAGQRAAINIASGEKNNISRGMLVTSKQYGQVSNIWDVIVAANATIVSGTRIRLHIGTGEFLGRMYSFKDSSNKYMRIIFEADLAAGAGERGIIRLYSPQYLLGAIMLIAPSRGKRFIGERCKLGQALWEQNVYNIVSEIVADSPSGITDLEIMRRAGYINQEKIYENLAILISENKIINLGSFYITLEQVMDIKNRGSATLFDFHRQYPERAGVKREIFRQKLGLLDKTFDKLMIYWQEAGHIVNKDGYVALPAHNLKYNRWCEELLAQSKQVSVDKEFTNIDINVLTMQMKLLPQEAQVVFDLLVSRGILIQLNNICIYAVTMKYIIKCLNQYFQKEKTITVSAMRDLLNTSRKIVLEILEYLDMHKYTIRNGDERLPGHKIIEFSEK